MFIVEWPQVLVSVGNCSLWVWGVSREQKSDVLRPVEIELERGGPGLQERLVFAGPARSSAIRFRISRRNGSTHARAGFIFWFRRPVKISWSSTNWSLSLAGISTDDSCNQVSDGLNRQMQIGLHRGKCLQLRIDPCEASEERSFVPEML